MQRDRSALALVRDLDLEPEHVAQLALERGEVGVDRPALVEDQLARALLGALGAASRPGAPTALWR